MARPRPESLRPYGIAAAVFAIAALAYLWPVLIGSKVVWPGVQNRVLTDVMQDFIPWLEYARAVLRGGHLPAWNPYVLSGAPFLANPQTAVASPLNLPVWLLPLGRGLSASYALKLWVAAMGTFALVRALGLRTIPAVVAGLAYGFLPFAIVWLLYPIANVWAFLPWMLWAGERLVRDGRAGDAAWLALASGAAFAGGHPESWLHVAAAAGLYVVLRLLQVGVARRERLRRLGLAALGVVAGTLLAAVVLLPVLLNSADSAYVQGRGHHGLYHLPLTAWHSALFPDWWGRPTSQELPGGPFNYSERTIYPGAVALVLAGIGVATTAWRRTVVWVVLGLIGLSAAIGLPPAYQVLSHLPPFDLTANTRLIWLLGLAVAVLAAYGTERLLDATHARTAIAVATGAVAVGLVAVVAQRPSLEQLKLLQNHFRTGADWPQVVRLTSVAWFVLLAGIVLVVAVARRRVGPSVAAAVLLGALVLDLGHFARGYNPFYGGQLPEPVAGAGHDRLIAVTLRPDSQVALQLRDPRGYDPPQPRKRYYDLWARGAPGEDPAGPVDIGGPVNFASRRLLELVSVRDYITVYGRQHDPKAQPRAFVPASVTRVAGERAALDAMFAPSFTPGRDAVVEGAEPPAANGRVSFLRDDPERVDLRAQLDRGGLVALADQLDRGWSVTVDERSARPLRVDSVMRGVAVPAGTHTVSWRYRAPGLRAGLLLSVVGLLLTAGLALWPRIRGERRSA